MSGKEYHPSLPKTLEEYLKVEFHPKVYRMAIRASFSKRMFFVLRTVALIGAAILPFIIATGSFKTLSIIVSILVALSIAIEESLNFKEKYIKLEGIINVVNKLKADFASSGGEFSNLSEEEKIRKFTELSGIVIHNAQNKLLEAFKNMEPPRRIQN